MEREEMVAKLFTLLALEEVQQNPISFSYSKK